MNEEKKERTNEERTIERTGKWMDNKAIKNKNGDNQQGFQIMT